MSANVVITGAGPTGLTLALMAQASGHEVTIYETSRIPDPRPRAVMMHARALEILAPLGVSDVLLSRGLMTPGIEFRREDGVRFAMEFSKHDSPYAGILNIRQPIIEDILSSSFLERGGAIMRGFTVTGFEETQLGVKIDIIDPTGTILQIDADWLFGCDGAHSTVRDLLGTTFEGSTLQHDYILGEGRRAAPGAPQINCMLISDAGVVSWLPFEDGTVRVAGPGRTLAPDSRQFTDDDSDPEATLFRVEQAHLVSETRYQIGEIIRAGRYKVHSRIASNWGRGRVWLAGDAAHVHPPAGGQALNLGFSDAEAIAMRLTANSGLSFDSYEAERRPIVEATLEEVAMMPLVAAMRQAHGDTKISEIERILVAKAHRLSQIDTDFAATGPERLGDHVDKKFHMGRRISGRITLLKPVPEVPGWQIARNGDQNFWVHADRHVRYITSCGAVRDDPFAHATLIRTLQAKERLAWR